MKQPVFNGKIPRLDATFSGPCCHGRFTTVTPKLIEKLRNLLRHFRHVFYEFNISKCRALLKSNFRFSPPLQELFVFLAFGWIVKLSGKIARCETNILRLENVSQEWITCCKKNALFTVEEILHELILEKILLLYKGIFLQPDFILCRMPISSFKPSPSYDMKGNSQTGQFEEVVGLLNFQGVGFWSPQVICWLPLKVIFPFFLFCGICDCFLDSN